MLEVMELEELIATSESDYLQISTRLLREPQFHQNIKDLIKERAHRLFRDEGIARAFRDWALATCASVREEETQTIQSQKEQS
jgi:predicted O-linked N-acetylglucosamine transferase (SPINDLY family)